ncbi:MAG: type II toxin-antitoxin system Phd/YefM family antitoxin [Chloroflexi bacterium]|nr:type II toxin-antitoxin system Phd/YefM family antitoxin [Chloroflexota bacterium]
MVSVGVRELKNRTSQIIRAVHKNRAEYVVTVQGRPAAIIVPIELNGDDWEDFVIANHPYFVERRRKAREAIARGEVVTLEEAFANLEKRKRPMRKRKKTVNGSPRRARTPG